MRAQRIGHKPSLGIDQTQIAAYRGPARGGGMVDWGAKLKRELTRPFRALKPAPPLPLDFSSFQKALIAKVRPYTMTSAERIAVLESAVRHIIAQNYTG